MTDIRGWAALKAHVAAHPVDGSPTEMRAAFAALAPSGPAGRAQTLGGVPCRVFGAGDEARIVNTTSVNAFAGMGSLIAYSATRGASLAFTRSLAQNLVEKGIQVNPVAPGPIWTPFIPGTMPEDEVEDFGSQTPMGRAGQPWEVATAYLFLCSSDGSYYNGQTLHPNGGMIVGG